ncbi:MAG: M48 family metalloprotease [Pseudomonadota bacterium]
MLSSLLRAVFVMCLMFASGTAQAVSLLRDAGMERALNELARPILTAAGVSPARTRILVVDDSRLNAFVITGDAIYVHSGLILKLESAAQLQAVIAHEAAHIANGHLARRINNMRNAQRASAVGMAIGVFAGAAGAGSAAAGIAAGSAGTAQRAFLAHTRTEESSADQSSVRYLLRAGVDPRGALEVLDLFRGQEALSVSRQDPYSRSHPLTTDRYRALEALVGANPGRAGSSAEADYWFARAQGVLSAFKRAPSWTLRRATGSGDIDQMRRAVAHHRKPDKARAIREVTALVAARPNDPYYRDLQGQILLENRETAAAVQAYARAVQLAPNDALILGAYGKALLAQNTAASNRTALDVLVRARSRDGRDSRTLQALGLAYARAGQPGQAALAGAERLALSGRLADALPLARRAAGLLPQGSTGWTRAQDIIRTAEALQ